MSSALAVNSIPTKRPEVRCECGRLIFDGDVIKSRIIKVLNDSTEAKCASCKCWVRVPLTYQEQ